MCTELNKILNCKKTKTGEILQKLEKLNFIKRRREKYFSNEDSLIIQLINIAFINFLRGKPLKLFATYVKTAYLAKGIRHTIDNEKTINDEDLQMLLDLILGGEV